MTFEAFEDLLGTYPGLRAWRLECDEVRDCLIVVVEWADFRFDKAQFAGWLRDLLPPSTRLQVRLRLLDTEKPDLRSPTDAEVSAELVKLRGG